MTRLFGVIGHPISHSLSPVMHAAALRAMRVDALYASFDVPPALLRPMLRGLILSGVEGLNVTVPLKERVVPLLNRVDPSARALGAVNTIVVRGRRTTGYNTDGVGFVAALKELGWRPGPVNAVVLGAGGAARAVAWELARFAGSRITIANRHPARARRLARRLAGTHPRACVDAAALRHVALKGIDVLVNATSVGRQPGDTPLIDPARLSRDTVVYDLVYHCDTRLVRAARRRGCVAANGLTMLLYQGAESLRLWFGRRPPVAVMRRALEKAVES